MSDRYRRKVPQNELKFPLSRSDNNYEGTIKFAPFRSDEKDVFEVLTNVVSQVVTADADTGQPIDDNELPGKSANDKPQATVEQALNARENDKKQKVSDFKNVRTTNRREKSVEGSVQLYLPQAVQINDAVNYDNIDLGRFGATAESLLQSGEGVYSALTQGGVDAFKSLASAVKNPGTQDLAVRVAATDAATKFLPTGAGGAVKSATKVTANPNTRVLFRSVNLREFTFSFKMMPVSAAESEAIKQIIEFFRRHLYPETIFAANLPIGYFFPDPFNITLTYRGNRVATKILPSYLVNFSSNYNASGMGFHRDGNFSEVDISMTFRERQTLDYEKIRQGF